MKYLEKGAPDYNRGTDGVGEVEETLSLLSGEETLYTVLISFDFSHCSCWYVITVLFLLSFGEAYLGSHVAEADVAALLVLILPHAYVAPDIVSHIFP